LLVMIVRTALMRKITIAKPRAAVAGRLVEVQGTAADDRGPPCSHGPATAQITREPRLKVGWRAAAAAYRLAYGEPSNLNRGHAHEAMTAAIAAFKQAVLDISDREAMLESVAAISYAASRLA
jgi:hypothetical protein